MEWPDSLPTLDYIAEKVGNSLAMLHALYRDISRYVPDDLTHSTLQEAPISIKRDMLLSQTFHAFRYELTAYLSLINRENAISSPDIFTNLLGMSTEEFEAWLEFVEGNIDYQRVPSA
jgi:hypothetical protein